MYGMTEDSTPREDLPLTPCMGLCRLASDGYCEGCRRSGTEIARWGSMSQAERRYVMQVVLPRRGDA